MTNQKKVVLDYFKKTKAHPSAEKVYKEVRKKLPCISQGTVYRILNNLEKKHEIQTIKVKGKLCFDGDISDHSHFICLECDKIYDICNECSECKVIRKKRVKVGKIKYYKIYFYGICKQCQKK